MSGRTYVLPVNYSSHIFVKAHSFSPERNKWSLILRCRRYYSVAPTVVRRCLLVHNCKVVNSGLALLVVDHNLDIVVIIINADSGHKSSIRNRCYIRVEGEVSQPGTGCRNLVCITNFKDDLISSGIQIILFIKANKCHGVKL